MPAEAHSYWVQAPGPAGTRFNATTAGAATAVPLMVPPGAAEGEWMVIGTSVAASEVVLEQVGELPVVHGVPVETEEPASQPPPTEGGVAVGRRVATPTTLQVLRGVLAQGTPLWEAGDATGAEAVFKAGYDRLVGVDRRMAPELAAMERNFPGDNRCWQYRRAFDNIINQDREGPSAERFLYFWDERDGDNWMGWWITPDHIGCTRFYAHAPVDAETPDLCGGQWKEPMDQMVVVAASTDDGVIVGNAIEARAFLEGHYARAPCAVHAHKGASGAVRPVYTWDRPLSVEEKELVVGQHRLRSEAPPPGCCVVS